MAVDAQVEQEALAAELSKTVTLGVYEKGFSPSKPEIGLFQAYVTFKGSYENISTKDIRALKGVVIFQDLFGSDIYQAYLTISSPVKAGAKAKWAGGVKTFPSS